MVSRPRHPLPLNVLARRLLRFAPPSLSALLDLFVNIEAYKEFLDLVQEYLPERLEEVKRLPDPVSRLAFFANHFKDRYFPLSSYFADEGDPEDGYGELLRGIPIDYQGVDYEWLHEVENWDSADLLMGSLHIPNLDSGLGVVWLEACAEHVDKAQLERLPPGGWSRQELHRLLDGTEFEAAATCADWQTNGTGNPFLDCHYEYPLEDDWDMKTVQTLTADWQKAEVLWKQMCELSDWLEEDLTPNSRYTEMLDFIFQREEELGPPPVTRSNRTLAEIFAEPEERQ